MVDSLTLVVHGESGVGKSYFADTAPGPRLVFDVEGGVRFTPSKKVSWDPRDPLPELEEGKDTVVVTVTDLDTIQRGFQWLTQGQHPFRSVIIDSLTEVQKRAIDAISGGDQMKLQDYGALLRKIEALVRAFRDLTLHQTNPVQVVVFVCGTAEKGQDHPVMRPALVGRMAEALGYYVDVMGYMTVAVGTEGELERRMQFAQVDGIAAKDRTGKLGVGLLKPSIPGVLELVYGPEEA
jgi:hypothetical protein